jgi:hypothetical protein
MIAAIVSLHIILTFENANLLFFTYKKNKPLNDFRFSNQNNRLISERNRLRHFHLVEFNRTGFFNRQHFVLLRQQNIQNRCLYYCRSHYYTFTFFLCVAIPFPKFSITNASAPIISAFRPIVETFTSVCSANLGIQYLFNAC